MDKKKIQERIEVSKAKYQALRAEQQRKVEKRKAFKAKCHEGNQFLKQWDTEAYSEGQMELNGDFTVYYVLVPFPDMAASREGFTVCKSAYAVKAPTDKFKKHVGSGLCGYRIKHGSGYTATIEVPTHLIKAKSGYVIEALECIIKSRILLMAPEIPQRMINFIHGPVMRDAENEDKKPTPTQLNELRSAAMAALLCGDFQKALRLSTEMLKGAGASQKEIDANATMIRSMAKRKN